MDAECSQLLPHVCGVLVDNRQLMTDDSIYEKLLDWFKELLGTVSAEGLLNENPCIPGLFQQVLSIDEADHSLLTFSMRLAGELAAQEGGFKYLMPENTIQDMFGEWIYTNETWKDASIRRAWIQGLLSMVQHQEALHFLLTGGIIERMLNLLMDSSLFVASAVNDLVAHVFLMFVKLTGQTEISHVSDLPYTALRILGYLEKLLTSGDSQSVTQSLKLLTAIFRGCTNTMAEVLWPRIAELVTSLLRQKPVHAAPHLEELLLVLTRFPVLCSPEHDLWMVMKEALKSLNPFQAGSLAYGILKSKSCSQDVCLPAMCVLLQPLDCVLRSSAADCGPPGFLDELVSDPSIVENLMSKKVSCVSLLCQCLIHLTELREKDCLAVQVPYRAVLSSVVLILSLCLGHAIGSSAAGFHLGRSLIGSLRVQRSALDAIGGLSRWPLRPEELMKTYNVLTAYLENPETDATVLKKAFQASVKWLQAWHTSDEHWEEGRTFLQGLCPVIMKRLCSPSWEVRDTTLEFITNLTATVTGRADVGQVLSDAGLPQLVLDLLNDPESYVRASAVTCIGQIVNNVHTSAAGDFRSVEALKREDLVPHLMDILCHDTEGFPRRAVVKVFTDWLRKGHMQTFQDSEMLLSQILATTCRDLDWEVKVNALDLAHFYISHILEIGPSHTCPYTIGLPSGKSTASVSDALGKCERVGLFQALLSCLCDCDRPVALKACEILLEARPTLCHGGSDPSELHGRDWLEHIVKGQQITSQDGQQSTEWAADVLRKIDLENIKCSLSKSSDYLHETPLSLLQDIKATLWGGEMHDADCY
ncbi:BRCA1-associated ATM activator 1 isoform X1 [Bufo bufo]|uniref:BRCA1-associated ATM activator 1 isoform X1 n=2 Tax=Bufo bufo TaxID=8384 RepID=UPI001ABE71A9|nr:BRCA1-associated ATM activator 1 isoform X1 [Bufo bufo]XP_040296813.1 BRCA1-associated ATM activator 1 isoform X1 [Bufo bufo]